jgi:hypothetical protein
LNIELLELAADSLADLRDEVVFLGGATVELWISDPAAPEVRPTDDVDVVVEVATRQGYLAFEQRLGRRGFQHDQDSGVICRFRHGDTGLVLDAMPLDPKVLGFENRWQARAVARAVERKLPSGRVIRAIPPVYLLATKLEAFRTRGKGDFLASRDFGDIIALIDGRPELAAEFAAADEDVRRDVGAELTRLQKAPLFDGGIAGALLPDDASQARRELVLRPRIDELIAMSS